MTIKKLAELLNIPQIEDVTEEDNSEISLGIYYDPNNMTIYAPLNLEIDELYEKIIKDTNLAPAIYTNLVNYNVINRDEKFIAIPKWVFVSFILYHEEAHHLLHTDKLKVTLNYNFYPNRDELDKIIKNELEKINISFAKSLSIVLESRASQIFCEEDIKSFCKVIINELCSNKSPNYEDVTGYLWDKFVEHFEQYLFSDTIENFQWYHREIVPIFNELCNILIKIEILEGNLYRCTGDEITADLYACKKIKEKAQEMLPFIELMEHNKFKDIFNLEQ